MFSFKQLVSYEARKRTCPNFVRLEIGSTSRSAFFSPSEITLGLAATYSASLALAQNGVQAGNWFPLSQQVCKQSFPGHWNAGRNCGEKFAATTAVPGLHSSLSNRAQTADKNVITCLVFSVSDFCQQCSSCRTLCLLWKRGGSSFFFE